MIKTEIERIINDYQDKAGFWDEINYPNRDEIWNKGLDASLVGSPLENLENDVLKSITINGGTTPICNKSFADTCDGDCLEITYVFSYLNGGVLETYSGTIATDY